MQICVAFSRLRSASLRSLSLISLLLGPSPTSKSFRQEINTIEVRTSLDLTDNTAAIFALQETHISEDHISRLKIPNYDLIAYENHPRYGLAILTKKDISNNSFPSIKSSHSISITHDSLTIHNIYKPPSQDWNQQVLPNTSHPSLYCGDFNSHHNSWGYTTTNTNGELLEEWANNNLLHLIYNPKQNGSFSSGRWNTRTNPDLCFVSTDHNNKPIPTTKRILKKFPKSQHHPIILEVGHFIPVTLKPFLFLDLIHFVTLMPNTNHGDVPRQTQEAKILSNIFDDNAFMCLNDGNPTHHSYSYNTAQALDISFSSPDIFHKCKWQILKSIGSDHLPILIEISTKTKTSSINEKFWNFKKANWNFYQQSTNEDFGKAPTRIKDLEQNWISFKNTIIKAAKVSIPRGNIKKWIPNYTHQAKDIQTLITERNELQKKCTQNQTNCRADLKIVNAKIKRLYVNMKREKWKQTCEKLNPRNPNTKLWHLAKQIDRAQPQTENTNMINKTDCTPATNDKNAEEIYNVELPKTFGDVQQSQEKENWVKAMKDELKIMEDRKVWKLADRPPQGVKVLGNKWVIIHNISIFAEMEACTAGCKVCLPLWKFKRENLHATAKWIQNERTKHYRINLSNVINGILTAYSDANWGSHLTNRHSTSGYILYLDDTPFTWKSRKQKCIALSSMESGFIALTESVKEIIWQSQTFTKVCLDHGSMINESCTPIPHSMRSDVDLHAASPVAQNKQGRVQDLGRGFCPISIIQSPQTSHSATSKQLSILQCNINGLCSTATKIKLEEIMEIAEKQKIQIIALQETKLNKKYNLKYKNFNILRKDRNKEGGGLAFLIKNLYYEDIAINIPHIRPRSPRAKPQTENTNMINKTDCTPATNDRNAANLLGNSYQISSKIKFEIKDKKVEKKARKIIHDCKNVTSTHNIFHEKINMKELDYALENTDLNKTPGPDGIHGQIISNLGKNGKEKLLDIFNNSWKTGKLPQDWKTATIIPIKKLDKSVDDPKNYRPISLTSICCKLMEKIILRRLTYHLDTRNLFPEEQYGFRKGHGTIDQLLFFTQKVKDAQNRKPTNHTIAAFLDLTQAFDKVWKNKLITKLYKHFKIDGKAITWINDFLKNRYIRVKYNGTLSKTFKLYQGLPQGSVLSPTLFTLFIAGIEEKISHKTNIGLFADDIILWSSNTNWKKAERDLNKTLFHLEKFANKHKLEFNPQKSETCLFTTDKKLYKIRPKIILKEQQLQYNKHPKYLGYTLDPEINS
ncbi:hypothetical protein LAZ67_20001180, partial [Cordylochernes scorpioides]